MKNHNGLILGFLVWLTVTTGCTEAMRQEMARQRAERDARQAEFDALPYCHPAKIRARAEQTVGPLGRSAAAMQGKEDPLLRAVEAESLACGVGDPRLIEQRRQRELLEKQNKLLEEHLRQQQFQNLQR